MGFDLLQFCWIVAGSYQLEEPLLPPRWRKIGHSIAIVGILGGPGNECSLCLAGHWVWEVGELLHFGHKSYRIIDADRTWGRFRKGCTCVPGMRAFEPESPALSGLQLALLQVLARFERLGLLSAETLSVL